MDGKIKYSLLRIQGKKIARENVSLGIKYILTKNSYRSRIAGVRRNIGNLPKAQMS